jgi:hypothetical protein
MARDARAARRRLAALQRKFKLPRGCALSDTLLQRVRLGGLELYMVGLVSSVPGGSGVVGAAADRLGFPVECAFFELIERVSLWVARAAGKPLRMRDHAGAVVQTVAAAEVFPSDAAPSRIRASLSNGVALQRSWSAACDAARCELVERDRVLRSFRGEFAPIALPLPDRALAGALRKLYDLEAYAFAPAAQRVKHSVSGLFLFPRKSSYPLAYGFGAALDADAALAAATREALQRLAFLWDEVLPSEPPTAAPTPDYHQEYYLYPPHHAQLRRWLAGRARAPVLTGRRARAPVVTGRARSFDGEAVWYADLTPPALRAELCVVRASSPRARALLFGHAPRSKAPVHPVA